MENLFVNKDENTLALLELLVQNPDSLSKNDLEKLCDAISKETLNEEKESGTSESVSRPQTDAKIGRCADTIKEIMRNVNRPASTNCTRIKSAFPFKPIVVSLPLTKESSNKSQTSMQNTENKSTTKNFVPIKPNENKSQSEKEFSKSKTANTFDYAVPSVPHSVLNSVENNSTNCTSVPLFNRIRYTLPRNDQAICTTDWLINNFEENKTTTVPRNIMYQEYVAHIMSLKLRPFNQAVFGKIIRSCFPNLSTRRLGVRGMSRYHYAGLGVKIESNYSKDENSPLSTANVSRTASNQIKSDVKANKNNYKNKKSRSLFKMRMRKIIIYNLARIVHVTSLPAINDVITPINFEEHNGLQMFLKLLESHHKKFLCVLIKLEINETLALVRNFIDTAMLSFHWLLKYPFIWSLIRVFDDMAYHDTMAHLLPEPLAELQTDFKTSVRKFAKTYVAQLSEIFESCNLPKELEKLKTESAKAWETNVKRTTTLCHVAEVARKCLADAATTKQLLWALSAVSFDDVVIQGAWCGLGICEQKRRTHATREFAIVKECLDIFETLLKNRQPLQSYIHKLDEIIDKHAGMEYSSDKGSLVVTPRTREFLMKWSLYTSKFLTEISLHTKNSIGTFHLVTLLFQDYIYHVVALHKDRASVIQNARVCLEQGSSVYNRLTKFYSFMLPKETNRPEEYLTAYLKPGTGEP